MRAKEDGMADTALLKNGRHASLTEAGWEVWPHRSDTKAFVFGTQAELARWADTHDFYGKRLPKKKDEPRQI